MTIRPGVARLNTDGTLDPSFDPGVGSNLSVTGIITKSDGKIIVYGFFTTFNGADRPGIAQLNGNGSLDSFNPGRGISIDGLDDGNGNAISSGAVNSVILQPEW